MDSKILSALGGLSSSLNSAVQSMGTRVNSGSLVSALKGLERGLSKSDSGITKFNSKVGIFVYTMKEVGEIMSEAALRMTGAARELVEAEQRLATVNSTLSQATLKQVNEIQGITGGSRLAAQAFTEFRIMGFKEVNANLIDLGNRMKLTSQNTDGLLKLGGFLLGPGGMNEKQIDALSKTIVDTSLKTGLALDDVVEGVATLSDNMASQAMMGTSARVAQAQALFQRFAPGPQMADQFAELSKIMLTDPEFLFQVAAPAGVLPDLRKLKRDPSLSDSAILNLQVKILRQIAAHSDNIVGNTRDGTNATDELVYQSLLNNNQLVRFGEQARFLLNRAQEEGDPGPDRISELLVNFRQQLLGPFNNAVAKLMPAFKGFMADLIEFGTSVLNAVSYFEPFISDFLDSFGGFFRLAGTVLEEGMAFIGPMFEGVFSTFKEIVSSLGVTFERLELAVLHLAQIFSTGEEDKRIQSKIDRVNLSISIKNAAEDRIARQRVSANPDEGLIESLKSQFMNSRMLAAELMQGGGVDSMPAFADGGIVTKPTIAQIGEAGSEAVIPLKNGSVPVQLKSKESNGFLDLLDNTQAGLSMLGMIPAIGIFADALNTGITGGRLLAGDDRVDMGDLALDAASMIPFGAGQAAAMAKLSKKTTEIVDRVSDGNKILKKSVDLAARAATGPLDKATKLGVSVLPGGGLNRVARAGSRLNLSDLESIDQESVGQLLEDRYYQQKQRDALAGQKSVAADSALMDAIYGMGSARGIPSTQQAEAITRSVDLREQNRNTTTVTDFAGSEEQKKLQDKLNNLELHLPNQVRDLIGTKAFTDQSSSKTNQRMFDQFKHLSEGDLKTVKDYFQTKSLLAGITDISTTETTGKFKNLRDPGSLERTITKEMVFDPATTTFDVNEIPEASRKAMFDYNRFGAISHAAKAELTERRSLSGGVGAEMAKARRDMFVKNKSNLAAELGSQFKDQVKGISSEEFMHMTGSRMEVGPSYLTDTKTKLPDPTPDVLSTPYIPYTDTTGKDTDFLMNVAPRVGEYGMLSQKNFIPSVTQAQTQMADSLGGSVPELNKFQGMNLDELRKAQYDLGQLEMDLSNAMDSALTVDEFDKAESDLADVLSQLQMVNSLIEGYGAEDKVKKAPQFKGQGPTGSFGPLPEGAVVIQAPGIEDRASQLRAQAQMAESFGGNIPGLNQFQGMNLDELYQAQYKLGQLEMDFGNAMDSAETLDDLNKAEAGLKEVLMRLDMVNSLIEGYGPEKTYDAMPLPEIDQRSVPQSMEPFSRVTNRDDTEVLLAVRDQLRDSSEKQMGFLEQIAAASEKTAGNTKPKVDIGAGFAKPAGGR